MSEPIKWVCANCGNTLDYDRALDPTIPKFVTKIVRFRCDQCSDSFQDEVWYDANGVEVIYPKK